MRKIILDTETTGLNPADGHRIIEICAVEMKNDILTGEKFHCYLNPEREVSHGAYMVHGISTEFLFDKPKFSELSSEFLNFLSNSPLIIHNAPFDLKFINYELSLLNMQPLSNCEVIDTLLMARRMFPSSKNSLDALCSRYNIDISHRTQHGALKDVLLLYEVYVQLTGGRQQKFDIPVTAQKLKFVADKSIVARGNGKLVKPSLEELEKHREFMSSLMQK